MKKIVLASAAMGGAALLAFGASGTFAAFSDQEVVAGQEASAGTLLLSVDGTVSAPVEAQDLAPGDSAVYPFFIQNVGKGVSGNLGGVITNVVDSEDGCTDPERAAFDPCRNGEDAGELSRQVSAQYFRALPDNADDCQDITAVPTTGSYPLGQLSAPIAAPASAGSTALQAGEGACFLIVLTLEDRPDNNLVQSDNVSFSVDFTIQQFPDTDDES
ncbi:TasA family protein [Modestobacter sp. Leaf380]|uniref:TasA family protein n=1 Tax=Modestobacter sp. Leaf380 TaxID=1736356 RepID=UPI0012F9E6D8|nr:TasA family protein [Modestobacter sp. Leaf380]